MMEGRRREDMEPHYLLIIQVQHLDQTYWNKKVYSDPEMRQYTGEIGPAGGADWINHRILRYADVLLMLAEASNETGDGATAEAHG